jgi:nucleoside-diphosphate-sugar epimerase
MSVGFALVTVGAGFIGSHLVDRLVSDGWRVGCYIISAAESGEY